MENAKTKSSPFPRQPEFSGNCLMTFGSGNLPVLADYRASRSEMEEIDVMRLKSILHEKSLTRPQEKVLTGGPFYAPVGVNSISAGWTEMVIQRDQYDSRVFPFAVTSPEEAPRNPVPGSGRSGLANGISLQAI